MPQQYNPIQMGQPYIVQFCDFVPQEHLDRPWVVIDVIVGCLLSSHYTKSDAEKFCDWCIEDQYEEGFQA